MAASSDRIEVRLRLKGGKQMVGELRAVNYETAALGRNGKAAGAGMLALGRAGGIAKAGILAVGRAVKYAAVGVGLFAVVAIPKLISAYRESYKVGRQTNAVIKSTGGIANITANQIGNLANALSLKLGIDDEEIQAGENLLLTFTKIRNEVGKGNNIFDQATLAALNLSAATGNSLKSSILQLGKALNGSSTGLTALSKSGVSFSDQQKKMITSLFDSGERLKAQKIILRELSKEFAGSAKANADPFDRLKVSVENLEEAGGKLLFPFLTKGATALTQFFNQMRTGKGAGGDFLDGLKGILATAKDFGPFFSNVIVPVILGVGQGLSDVAKILGWVGKRVAPLRPAFKFLGSMLILSFGTKLAKVVGAVGKLGKTLRFLLAPIKFLLNLFGELGASMNLATKIVVSLGVQFSGAIGKVIEKAWKLTKPFRDFIGFVGSAFYDILKPVFSWFADKIDKVIDKINDAKNLLPGDDQVSGTLTVSPGVQNQVNEVLNPNPPRRGRGRGNSPKLNPLPSRPGHSGRPIVHKTYIQLDGKTVAESTANFAELAALAA